MLKKKRRRRRERRRRGRRGSKGNDIYRMVLAEERGMERWSMVCRRAFEWQILVLNLYIERSALPCAKSLATTKSDGVGSDASWF